MPPDTTHTSFTDLFIKHPVLAIVVNLVILLAGWRALTSLPVQQYPKLENSLVVITTVYYGASAETIRIYQYADRTGGLRHQRRRLRGIDQQGRCQHRDRSPEAQPQQHGGPGGSHSPTSTGTVGAAAGSRTLRDRHSAGRPALRLVLLEFQFDVTDVPG